MRFRPLTLSLLLATGCASGPQFMPSNRDEALRRTERIGRLLYEADTLAAHGSDAFIAAAEGKPDARVRGYVVFPERRQVVFLGEVGQEVRRFGVIDLSTAGPPLVRLADAEPASEEERSMYAARAKALGVFQRPCDRVYNPIIIADPDRPQWLVYMLASTTNSREVIVGGHVRVVIPRADGATPVLTPLSRSCLTLDRQPQAGAETAAMYASHPLGAIPSETHVFTSLTYRLALAIIGNDNSTWMVEDGAIRPLQP